MNAGTAEVGAEIGKARKVAHTTPAALAACAGLAVAVPQFEDTTIAKPRAAQDQDSRAIFEFGPLRLTPGWLGDVRTGRRIAVTRMQMQFLQVLVAAGGSAVSGAELMRGGQASRTWRGREVRSRTSSIHITTLRRKLADIRSQAKIRTHAGMGYSIEFPGMAAAGMAAGTAAGMAGEAA